MKQKLSEHDSNRRQFEKRNHLQREKQAIALQVKKTKNARKITLKIGKTETSSAERTKDAKSTSTEHSACRCRENQGRNCPGRKEGEKEKEQSSQVQIKDSSCTVIAFLDFKIMCTF